MGYIKLRIKALYLYIVTHFIVPFGQLKRDFVLNKVASSYLIPSWYRIRLLRKRGAVIKEDVTIFPKCFFGGGNISIDAGCFVNYGCFFDTSAKITIGKNVHIAMNCQLITSNHEIGSAIQRAGNCHPLPITIGDGCWVGANTSILPGVTIGNGVVIAAGAVVAKDCSDNGLYAGVPAKRIKDIE